MKKLLVVLIVALLANTPLYAVCAQDGCGVSPCVYQELLYDTQFDGNCPYWNWAGVAAPICGGGDCWARLWQTGDSVTQTVTVPTHSGVTEIGFDFDMDLDDSPLSERLIVEILQGSTVVDTVVTLRASTAAPDFYSFTIDNWSGQTIKVRFRRALGPLQNDGGTMFKVSAAYLWVYN